MLRFVLALLLWSGACFGQTVIFRTNAGDVTVTLYPISAPKTVANFLKYVNKGAYNNSFFHRSVWNFVIQGGGYYLLNHQPTAIPQDPPVVNEFKVSNTRGTIAMAKFGNDPNSATNQWFFNLVDNSSNLNSSDGGFTVFGKIADAAGLAVMDKIASFPIYDAGSPFDSLPLMNYNGVLSDSNFVLVNSIDVLSSDPIISSDGVISASSFGAFPSAAPGSYIEIYGTSLAGSTRQWNDADFKNGNAPTSLDNVSVSVNGEDCFVYFVSPGQVNAQLPADLPSGSLPVVVKYNNALSGSSFLIVNPLQGGLLAPASFDVNGRQYAAATHANGSFVNQSVAGISVAPAQPGETLTFYGTGFGAVTPANDAIAGQIATGTSALDAAIEFRIAGTVANVSYAGLAPGTVGLYQFNVVVPANTPDGDAAIAVTLAGTPLQQTLYLPIHAN